MVLLITFGSAESAIPSFKLDKSVKDGWLLWWCATQGSQVCHTIFIMQDTQPVPVKLFSTVWWPDKNQNITTNVCIKEYELSIALFSPFFLLICLYWPLDIDSWWGSIFWFFQSDNWKILRKLFTFQIHNPIRYLITLRDSNAENVTVLKKER